MLSGESAHVRFRLPLLGHGGLRDEEGAVGQAGRLESFEDGRHLAAQLHEHHGVEAPEH